MYMYNKPRPTMTYISSSQPCWFTRGYFGNHTMNQTPGYVLTRKSRPFPPPKIKNHDPRETWLVVSNIFYFPEYMG